MFALQGEVCELSVFSDRGASPVSSRNGAHRQTHSLPLAANVASPVGLLMLLLLLLRSGSSYIYKKKISSGFHGTLAINDNNPEAFCSFQRDSFFLV